MGAVVGVDVKERAILKARAAAQAEGVAVHDPSEGSVTAGQPKLTYTRKRLRSGGMAPEEGRRILQFLRKPLLLFPCCGSSSHVKSCTAMATIAGDGELGSLEANVSVRGCL